MGKQEPSHRGGAPWNAIERRLQPSISTRLTLYTVVFSLIVVGLAAGSVFVLRLTDSTTSEVGRKWLTGTEMLGELADQLSEFRLAETYRTLAPDSQMQAEAEALASEHRRAVGRLHNDYALLAGGDAPRDAMAAFQSAWTSYLTAHDHWAAVDPNGKFDDVARYGATSHQLYRTADEAVDQLVEANEAGARARVEAVDRITKRSIAAATAVALTAISYAVWLVFRLRSRITRPLEAITEALSELAAGNREIRVPGLNRPDEIGKMAKAFDVFRANALALEQAHEATRTAQREAEAQARHDVLTGLPNRRLFSTELESALDRARAGDAAYSLLLIDLDRFKPVNDLQGHPTGDMVLCEVARRLRDVVRKGDTVVRLGGDEFAVIAEGAIDPQAHLDQGMRLARRIIAAIGKPIPVGDGLIEIGASIGIATCGAGHDCDVDGVLHEADIAMYRAKRDGRGLFRFFERSMDDELRTQAALEVDLRNAIAQGTIEPYYQPQVDIRRDAIYGFEVLARWRHREHGFVPPDIFIPLAENLGLISDLTALILHQACRDSRQWPEATRLSVNISPVQLKDPALPEWLIAILAEEGFAPGRLEIEITETALVSDINTAKSILTHLQGLGVTVALDDFGTGYSSLYHLRELRFDKVKIDKSFVQAMLTNRESEKIVDAILSLAGNLSLPTVAEGIEEPAVLSRLADQGCEYGQGYYFGKAMTAADVGELLREGKAASAQYHYFTPRLAVPA